ncbi:MAG TPA: sigma-54-dependent Fis family transcriptional regulator [Dokdonella sp.]
MSRLSSNAGLLAARERFFSAGERPTGLISNVILESWQRCAALGLPAQLRPEVEPLAGSALRELLGRHESLRRLCRNELEALHGSARAAGAIAILTAPDGIVLDAVGDAAFLDKAARVSLRPGVPWREDATGTNAIGTALVERRAVEVRGGEHYFEPYRILSCSAAPILDPFGRLAGVLDLSGEAGVHHVHALGLVQLAVDQIEHRLFDDVCAERELIRLHSDARLLGTPREGVLMFEGHRLVAANRYALALLGLDWSELGRRRYDELFSGAMPKTSATSGLRDHFGNVLHARRQPRQMGVGSAPARARPLPRVARPVIDAALETQLARAVRLIDADIPVLLQGETGTGKEVFARTLHQRCARASAAFVAINCAALPESLIESELFGYAPGAFTGARREGSPGLLREADGGVLFLDEIGDMPLSLQSRLLRVLQEREVAPLGGGRATAIDFAVIAASHRDLRAAVAAGEFRADLYYRVAQSQVRLAPLREQSDLRPLIMQIWASLGAADAGLRLGDTAMAALQACAWPGNFRQLVAVLREVIALSPADCMIGRESLPELDAAAPVASSTRPGVVARLDTVERKAMRDALAATAGNTSEAARRLGISRSTLYRRLRESG